MEIKVMGNLIIQWNEYDTVQRKQSIRNSPEYQEMKKRVKARDQVCQVCGELPVNGNLQIHHILPLSDYPDLGCDDGNCICLCQSCHARYHNRHERIDAVSFAEFMKNKGGK